MEKPAVVPPLSDSPTRIVEILEEIEEYRALEANWDLEGASAVGPEAADLAAELVAQVDAAGGDRGLPWERPEVGPATDGSIALPWERQHRRVLLIARSGHPCGIECVTRQGERAASREIVSLDGAVHRALWALGGQS